MHLYGKKVQNFKQLLLWSLWANFAQISYGASLGWKNERLLKWSQLVDQDGRHAFVCFEVLPPSQPNGVMSSAVSLPKHRFTGQA